MNKYNWKTTIVIFIIVFSFLSLTLSGCIEISGGTTETTVQTTTLTPTSTTTPVPIDTTWTPPPTGTVNDNLPSIADVVALVKPAVVAINTEVVGQSIFGDFTQEGAGSGWIIDSDGIIVTNNHVVEGANSITVTLDNGQTYSVDPDSVHTDALNDLAIFHIDATGLPFLNIGSSSDLRVGDWVIAIGNALGLGIRATEGIVSRQGVSIVIDQNETLYNLLETTAVINPGNSGGPLVNLSGEVIGITSAKIAQVGVEGMGYAISIDTALPIIQQLVNVGYVTRPWMGLSIIAVTPSVKSMVERDPSLDWNITVDEGILIIEVVEDSPVDKAGLQAGDVIASLNDEKVVTEQGFTQILYATEIGQPLKVEYYRGDISVTVSVFPIESPAPS
jgi:serine protease Do